MNYVYILTNIKKSVLYTGVTSNLKKRILQHKTKELGGFTAKYNVNILVYYEEFSFIWQAIEREKQIKGKTRKKKEDLINSLNPEWKELVV